MSALDPVRDRAESTRDLRDPATPGQRPRIVIAYDGSAGADHAITTAAHLFPGADALIVTVDEPVLETVAGAELVATGVWLDLPEAEQGALDAASRTADAGASQAMAAGLQATAQPVVSAPAWSEISRVATEVGADAIVVGSRGHGALVGALLGSVSEALVRHGGRPVVVVPPLESEPVAESGEAGVAHAG
jgi:nucleotide-binding universal stress UspA family protein